MSTLKPSHSGLGSAFLRVEVMEHSVTLEGCNHPPGLPFESDHLVGFGGLSKLGITSMRAVRFGSWILW